MKPKFQVGDLCPAVVIGTSPFRVAVLADMANDRGGTRLAVGVTTQSLSKCFAIPPRKGTRLVTVCYYSGQMGSGSWSDLLPTVVNIGCTHQEQIDRAMASMDPADFELLNRLTPKFKSDRNGLYKLWEMPEFAAELGTRWTFPHIPDETFGGSALRLLATVLMILHMAVAFAAIKRVWPECPPGVYGVITLICVLAVVGEIELVGRKVFAKRCVFFQLGDPGSWLVVGGMTLAFLLAGTLAVYESYGQYRSDQESAKDRAMWDDYHEKMRSANPRPGHGPTTFGTSRPASHQ